MSVAERLDRFQRRHPGAGFPLAVVYKFVDDQGSYLTAMITYYAFLSLFPLLLLLTSVLGFALRQAQQVSVTGWTWYSGELWIVGLALLVGVVTALVPAWRAHEVDIAGTLARG